MDNQIDGTNLVELTAEIVSAYVSHNSISLRDVGSVISDVHAALTSLGTPAEVPAAKLTPIMPIKKTLTPDYIVSLEDGRHYKSMKRHLAGRGLTPQQYREKWDLPNDYPMVASNYAKQRSELAKALGLGLQRRKGAVAAPVETTLANGNGGSSGRGAKPAKDDKASSTKLAARRASPGTTRTAPLSDAPAAKSKRKKTSGPNSSAGN